MRDGVMGEDRSEYAIPASLGVRVGCCGVLRVLRGAARERLDRHTAWGRLRT